MAGTAFRDSTGFPARLLAVIALLALAATYLTPLVNTNWNAWRYDHGHASLSGEIGEHSHPWSAGSTESAAEVTTDAGDPLVFTASEDSTPGITAIWRTAPIEASVVLHLVAVDLTPASAAVHELGAPAPPPPRTAS